MSRNPLYPYTHLAAYATIGLLLLLMAPAVQAQSEFGRVDQIRSNVDTYYFFTQPGEATMQIQVLGTLRTPGLYEVGESTTMAQLLALSGGPPLPARSNDTEVSAMVRLYRPNPEGNALIYQGPLEQGISNPTGYPQLQDDDVLMIEVTQRQRFGWRDASRVISTLGVLVLAIDRFSRLGN